MMPVIPSRNFRVPVATKNGTNMLTSTYMETPYCVCSGVPTGGLIFFFMFYTADIGYTYLIK